MKKLALALTAIIAALAAATTVQAAAFSENWYESGSEWKITNGRGEDIKNSWLCDDAITENGKDVWYLLDANGNMITAGLVQDGTGNFYSIETEHNGYYGMLRYQSGVYGGVYLELESSHNGSFAAIKNEEGIEALKAKYGVTGVSDISSLNCVYTSALNRSEEHVRDGGGTGSRSTGGFIKNTTVTAAGSQKSNYEKIIEAHNSSPTAFYPASPEYGFKINESASYVRHFMSDQILPDMVDRMVESLEKIKNQKYDGRYYLKNTGIYYAEYKEAYMAAITLQQLFACKSDIIVDCAPMTVCYINEDEPNRLIGEGECVRGAFIFVGFKKGVNPQRVLERHYQSKAVIDSLIAQAPEGEEEKARFFHDAVCEMTTYDHEGLESGNMKSDVADAVLDGCCVCSGYAGTFFNLAYYSGMNVGYLIVDGDTEDEKHAKNAVKLDGVWYVYDCTWDDSGDTLRHKYCKVKYCEKSQESLNSSPFRT